MQARLRRAWSPRPSSRWRPDDPALGHCSATALVVRRAFGGKTLRTLVSFEGRMAAHFRKRIAGRAFDVTAEQFAAPVRYDDLPATEAEAMAATASRHVARLTAAFHAARRRTSGAAMDTAAERHRYSCTQ